MPESKSIQLLLVEDDLEDEQLLSEALLEIEETRLWHNWNSATLVRVDQLVDALDCLNRESFDAILLNLTLPDGGMLLDCFRAVHDCAGSTPIVVLADSEDRNLANLLLRSGAQDVLLKTELECGPLARSIRFAVERHRRINSLRTSPFEDELTGALNRTSFFAFASRYLDLSNLGGLPLMAGSIEITGLPDATQTGRDTRDLLLLHAADALRSVFEPPTLIGFLGASRFGLLTAAFTRTTAEALLNRAALRIESALAESRASTRVSFSIAPIDGEVDLEELLGENSIEFASRTHSHAKTVMLAD